MGITLIEMMVALAITSFVILVVNQLFNSVISTVARGTQAGELLQKSTSLDEQLAFETDLALLEPYDATLPPSQRAALWRSRMVGPAGRTGLGPGGFLAIVQRTVQAPLTIQDGIRNIDRTIRSDQLMFVYDQNSPLDAGTKRFPAMAPSSPLSYTGDERDSINAQYVRMWYGHVIQMRDDQDPTLIDMLSGGYADIDLGNTVSGNPNVLAQDWVLGRHALFLTDSSGNPLPRPYGAHVVPNAFGIAAFAGISSEVPNSPRLANGMADVANLTLSQLTGTGLLGTAPNLLAYQGLTMLMMFTQTPLLTAAKPLGTSDQMRSWDVSPTHTYFMGGVSDFIVEFAGDLVNDQFSAAATPAQVGADGELDRDAEGRIKWYTALGANYPTQPGPIAFDPDRPITYPVPDTTLYDPHMNPALLGPSSPFNRANAAFVWQHWGSPGFTQWPWMLRIRYRLHDRRGDFEGREVINNTTGQAELEPGKWYETIIPVNYQDLP